MIKYRQVKLVKDGQAKMVNYMDKQRGATKWRRKDGQRWTSEDGTPVAEYDWHEGDSNHEHVQKICWGVSQSKNNSNNEIRKSSSCSSVIQTWRSHISSLLKSTIGKHFQHDLESEHCCEEVVKVTQDPAKWFWFDNLLKWKTWNVLKRKPGNVLKRKIWQEFKRRACLFRRLLASRGSSAASEAEEIMMQINKKLEMIWEDHDVDDDGDHDADQ